jgi:hypothetical protein
VRILHVDTGARMRGGQHQVLLLLGLQAEAGHEAVLLARKNAPLFQAASEAGHQVHAAGPAALLRYSGRADLVHAHDARAHTLCAIGSRQRYVVSRRVAFPVSRALPSKWKYRSAARYIAVSRFVAAELEAGGIPADDIDVVFDAAPAAAGKNEWSPENPAIALASDDPMKGRDLVVGAAKISGVEVRFSQDLPKDLLRASMFVYITRSEGLGSAALLAMNLGVPVIASKVGGLAEVFDDGISGLFVKNEPPEIAKAMRRLLGNRALAERLIEGGRERIADRFTPRHLLEGTQAAYVKALVR